MKRCISITLSSEGWIYGIFFSSFLILHCIFGLILIYQSKKTNAKLLLYIGLSMILISLGFLGNFLDFLTILLTGTNIDNSQGIVGILNGIWLPLGFMLLLYVYIEVINLKYKKYIYYLIIILSLFSEIFLLSDIKGSFTYITPSNPGENVIRDNIILSSPYGIIMIIYPLLVLIFGGFLSLIRGMSSKGILKKKQVLMSISAFLYIIIFLLLNFEFPIFVSISIRYGLLGSFILFYLALREEKEQKLAKKEVKIEDSLFRISKRPAQITEEEVSISKEKKICLVCKGKVLGVNFICPQCETFYCIKCSEALSNMENMCWVCDAPIDPSKPIKPYEREKEEVSIEIAEKSHKDDKNDEIYPKGN